MNVHGRAMGRREFVAALAGGAAASLLPSTSRTAGAPNRAAGPIRAGAAAVDTTPTKLPVIVNGGFLTKRAAQITDRLHARCLVLQQGGLRMAIVVVDMCVMPRELLDETKQLARKATGIPTDRILISATHTHSAPSVMGCLGADRDDAYARFLPGRIVQSIKLAAENLAPAKVGWAAVKDFEHTRCRRWIFRPDCMIADPFGEKTVRAMMHPGHNSPRHVGPSGPIDPGLSLVSVQSPEGRPIALLANYSMHYYGGVKPISADYFGRFAAEMQQRIGTDNPTPPVVMMSQGTSGDLHWMDYSQPAQKRDIDAYAEAIAKLACDAYEKIEHRENVPLAMAERKLRIPRRVPNAKRLAWARKIVADMGNRLPRSKPEVYAREAFFLRDEPSRELKLQAIRIGEVGITAMPCEAFGITGLKIKAASPLSTTFNIELANGEDGYIAPPEQHALGGYTTWPARTAGLEVQAEPKIVEIVLQLLEEVAGRTRRKPPATAPPYARAILASRPVAYWRLDEMQGPGAADAAGANHGAYEKGVAFYLPGHDQKHLTDENVAHRAAHFAGGRMKADVKGLGETYSVAMWFWNGMPVDARAVTGYFFSRGADGAKGAPGDHLGITGKQMQAGKLLFYNGDTCRDALAGTTALEIRTWHHVVLARKGVEVAVYLDGNRKPEIVSRAKVNPTGDGARVFIGGRSDGLFNLEGKADEVAVYNRALTADEAARLYGVGHVRSKT